MAVSITEGWISFLKALIASKAGDVSAAAEEMYKLNVWVRGKKSGHPIFSQIYELKNNFVEFLYRRGDCIEAKMHIQEFPCWGTWNEPCGPDCPKCDGTGIYRTERLYAFRFLVNGKRYAWHQPARYVHFQVELTEAEPSPYQEPQSAEVNIDVHSAWFGCCVVWWCLVLHGKRPSLLLFSSTRNVIHSKIRHLYKPVVDWFSNRWPIRVCKECRKFFMPRSRRVPKDQLVPPEFCSEKCYFDYVPF